MSWHLYDRIRKYTRAAKVYQQERLFQNQSSLDRIMAGGELLDFSQQQALLDQTNLQINRLERYKDYDQMDEMGENSLALDLYADESSLVDPEYKHTIIIKSDTKAVKEELEDLFFNQLLIDNRLRPMIRYLCKYGDAPFEIVPSIERDSIASIRFMNVYHFTRVETKHGDLVGFFHQDEVMEEPQFLHPWQVMHLRLTSYGNIYHPYGRAVFEGGRKAFKQLRLMEDAALIYRITRAPEKRIFKIPIGNIAAKDVPEFMQSIARTFKNNRFFDPLTGKFNERYSPLIQEDDFFLPVRPEGIGPSIDTLKGAENLDQIKDIEYFKKKMISPTKIPFSRVGIGEGAGEGNEKSVSSTDVQFAKAVQWVQREVAVGLTKIAICHLAMAGYSMEDLKSFDISLTATSAIDELYRMETWGTRTSVMAELKDLGWFPKEWIVTRFTDLSPDEIEELSEIMADQIQFPESMGGAGGGGMPGGLGGLGEGEELPGIEGEAGAAEEEGEAGGMEAGLEAPGPEEDLGLGLEVLDRQYKSVVAEEKRQKLAEATKKIIRNVRAKTNSPRSVYSFMVNNNELDGLEAKRKDGDKVLVESSVDQEIAEEAITEFRNILLGVG